MLLVHADAPNMMQVQGPGFVLWGRHPRCRVWMRANYDDQCCNGRITFQARSIQSGSWVPMVMTTQVENAI